MTGHIRSIRYDRGFCFIRCEDGTEVFAHASKFIGSHFDHLVGNERVEFDLGNDDRVPERVQAVNILVL